MTVTEAFDNLQQQLQVIYDNGEPANIADWVIEAVTGRRRRDYPLQGHLPLDANQQQLLEKYTGELLRHRPVQYVLGESYFYDMKLYVDESVLIPRPETEELAHWVLQYLKKIPAPPIVADIGTGSGCLALAIKKHHPAATVYALDISEPALAVAARNAAALGLGLVLQQRDILAYEAGQDIPQLTVIVSNPPYITLPEQEAMMPHVLGFEPHNALFVTDNDPLQFYKAIEVFAAQQLQPGGAVFLELNRDFAIATLEYYKSKGWRTVLRKDMQGEDRMLCCTR